eukprot:g1201.t1
MERDAAARRTLRAELEQAEAALAEIAAGGPPLGVLSARIDAAKAKKRESVRVAWRAKRDSERATLKSSALKVDATIRHSDPWKSCMNSALPLRKPTGAPSTAGKAFDLEGKTLWPSMPQEDYEERKYWINAGKRGLKEGESSPKCPGCRKPYSDGEVVRDALTRDE